VHFLLKFVSWFVLLYFVYCGFLFLVQRQMMFPRDMVETPAETEEVPGLEKIWINADREKVEAWFLPPVLTHQEKGPALIFAHGNAELIDFWLRDFISFAQMGIGVLLVEYPGYGRSGGTASQHSVTETFVAAYDLLISRKDVDPSRIILAGRSIGGGAICQLAARRPSAALILMSTFISARSFAIRYLAPGFLVRDPFDNRAVVASYPGPVLIIHGKNDETIPYSHGTALYEVAEQAKMVTYEAGHNDCPPNWEVFRQDVGIFLEENRLWQQGAAIR